VFRISFDRHRPARAEFLVAVARLNSAYDEGGGRLLFVPKSGSVSKLGFVRDADPEPFSCAPNYRPAQGQFYSDKFVSFRPGNAHGLLGRAEVREEYVYDEQYRADIDLTGLRLVLTLQQAAFERYERFAGGASVSASMTDPAAWHGDLLLRVRAPLFQFPKGRGSQPPYPPAGSREGKVGKLRSIKNFGFDAIDLIKIGSLRGSDELRVPDLPKTPSDHVLQLRLRAQS